MNAVEVPKGKVEVVTILTYPDNRLADIVEAVSDLKTLQAVEIQFEGFSRPATIMNKLERVFPDTTFKHLVHQKGGRNILRIWPNGRTLDQNFPQRIPSITSVRMGATGILIDPFNLSEEDIFIEDIAHHLGRMCRFNGGSTGHYSVADHCIKVSNRASEENKLWGLLHDAAEPYLGGITRPVRRKFDAFIKPVEDAILRVIADKFGLPRQIPQEIIELDNEACREELELLDKGKLTGNPYYTSSKMYLMALKSLLK